MATHKSWSHLTKEFLLDLREELVTWKAVGELLGIEHGTLVQVRKRLGMNMLSFPDHTKRRWRGSRMDRFEDQIREMAYIGKNCGEIARSIGEDDPEVVRDWMSKRGISRLSSGAPAGSLNPNWKGGQSIDADGYILSAAKGHPNATKKGYVRVHRLVMEAKLGRYLNPSEVVHHIDGNVQNNDPDNLELFETNGQHLRREWSDPEWAEHLRTLRQEEGLRRRIRPVSETDEPL